MRIVRMVLMALAGLASSAAVATANGGPAPRPHHVQPAQRAQVSAKASLPGSSYHWAQPVWRHVGGFVLPTAVAGGIVEASMP